MRKSAFLAVLILSALTFISNSSSASAMSLPIDTNPKADTSASTTIALSSVEALKTEDEAIPPQPTETTIHKVSKGESLSKIASQHSTTWKRLYNKNLQIQDPDVINFDEELVIPGAEESLAERELTTQVSTTQPAVQSNTKPITKPKVTKPTAKPVPNTRSVKKPVASGGNSYSAGYCTWYAKNRRPDLPNNLGNADTWTSRARAQGIPTGSAPRVGAIGQQGMHVVYVESVNGNGTVTISEMNFKGRGIVSSRTVPVGTFQYIY